MAEQTSYLQTKSGPSSAKFNEIVSSRDVKIFILNYGKCIDNFFAEKKRRKKKKKKKKSE